MVDREVKHNGFVAVWMNVSQATWVTFHEFYALAVAIIYSSSISSNGTFPDAAYTTLARCGQAKQYYHHRATALEWGLPAVALSLICILSVGIVGRPKGVYPLKCPASASAKWKPWRWYIAIQGIVIFVMALVLIRLGVASAHMASFQSLCERDLLCMELRRLRAANVTQFPQDSKYSVDGMYSRNCDEGDPHNYGAIYFTWNAANNDGKMPLNVLVFSVLLPCAFAVLLGAFIPKYLFRHAEGNADTEEVDVGTFGFGAGVRAGVANH